MSDLQDVIAANAVKAYNEGFARGAASERKRIIKSLENAIAQCGEECDYCVAQYDAIEMVKEAE